MLLRALLLCPCAIIGAAHAESSAQFLRFGADEGLSQGAVHAIAQDAAGFIWLGTEDGLNRYDGYSLLHIMRDRKAEFGLPNNWVAALTQDAKGQLWIGTAGGGVVRRDPVDGRFYPLVDGRGKPLSDPAAEVRVLLFDRSGRLWIGTRDSGVRVVDLAKRVVRELRHAPTDGQSLSNDSVFAIAEGADGEVWVGTATGIDRVDPALASIRPLAPRLAQSLGAAFAAPRVQAIRVDSRGMLWIGTQHGLVRYDPAAGGIELLKQTPADAGSLPNDNVTAILEDSEQRLWIGTVDGLALLDRRSNRMASFRNAPADVSSLPDNHIVSLYQDQAGLLWVGTKSGGTARWSPRSWSFGHRHVGDGDADNIASFVEDRRGTLWVGTMGGGLYAQNRATGALTRYRHDPQRAATTIGDDNVMALAVDDVNRIWIGTMGAGVERLDPRSGEIRHFRHEADKPDSLGASGVMSLLRDSRGRIWVGTYGGGLARIDADSGRVLRYPIGANGTGLSSDRATALAEDRLGLIWIGTDGGGLNVLDPATGVFRAFQHSPDDPASLSADTVYALHVDERGIVWVGTRGGGLDRVIGAPVGRQPVTFKNVSEADGLPNSTVYGIESETNGTLWLSTNRGLVRFNSDDGSIRSFGRRQGLQGDEFNFGAHYRSPAGELFFGGPRGYNAFFADRLLFNAKPPELRLTQFAKFNAPVALDRTLESVQAIDLGYRDDVVTFGFAALDYTAPSDNRYAYRLEGFDENWVQAGTARQATYTNLAGGHYVFRVRGANSDGTWNEQGLSIPVNVDSPPWQRWWAYLIYAAAFMLALFAVWQAQQRRLQRETAYTTRLAEEVKTRTTELAQRNAELQKANAQLEDASVTDPLTGLGNRRYLQRAVGGLLAQPAGADPQAAAPQFAFMIIDLDNLKPINDEHGHEAGDSVLVQVADILKRLCGPRDIVVRWGGDEFVMLCHGANLNSAAALAERLRGTVAKQVFRAPAGQAVRTSASIGFSIYPFISASPESVSWQQALAFADAAMYLAKRDRNDWVGWAGTAMAAELPHLQKAMETDPEALQRQGVLEVRRRANGTEDTVDQLRVLARERNTESGPAAASR